MKLRKLARLCEHDEIRKHWVNPGGIGPYGPGHEWDGSPWMCPGGVFLPVDTLVIEKVDVDDPECGDCDHLPRREWPEWAQRAVSFFLELDEEGSPTDRKGKNPRALDALADALSVREST